MSYRVLPDFTELIVEQGLSFLEKPDKNQLYLTKQHRDLQVELRGTCRFLRQHYIYARSLSAWLSLPW